MAKNTVEKTSINEETGEVTKEFVTYRKVKGVQRFVLLFIDEIDILININSKPERLLMCEFLRRCPYNSNQILIPVKIREEILNKFNITNGVYRNSLHRLKKRKLIHHDRGVIELNPFVIWAGNTDQRLGYIENNLQELKLKFLTNHENNNEGLDSTE